MIGLLLLLTACGPRPEDALRWSERWEMIGALEDGTTIDGRVSVGNTGLLRGQGHVRLERWNPHESPIIAGSDAPPGLVALDPDRASVRMGRDGIWQEEDGSWRFALLSSDLGATLTLDPELEKVGPEVAMVDGQQWASEAVIPTGKLSGWLESGKRGGLLQGRGVLIHRGGDGRPEGPRLAAFVLGSDLGLGIDTLGGASLSWVGLNGHLQDSRDAQLSASADGTILLDFRPAANVWASLRPRPPAGSRDPYEHLLGFERPLAQWALPAAPRELSRALAEVHVGETTRTLPALILRGGD